MFNIFGACLLFSLAAYSSQVSPAHGVGQALGYLALPIVVAMIFFKGDGRRNAFISMLIIALGFYSYQATNKYREISNFSTEKYHFKTLVDNLFSREILIDEAVNNCNARNVGSQHGACAVEQILQSVDKKTREGRESYGPLVRNTAGEYVQLSTGLIVEPNLNGLNQHQKMVFDTWLRQAKNNFKQSEGKINNDFIAIVFVIGLIVSVLLLLPLFWRFILNRIAEIARAIKGDKY